jgi:hypothetical protein
MDIREIEISRFKIYPIVKATRGQLFSAEFIEKDGSVRKILAHIRKPKENAKRPSPAQPSNSYVLVGDMLLYRKYLMTLPKEEAWNKSYRMINMGTVLWVKANKTLLIVKE